jgi:hypothetical protein
MIGSDLEGADLESRVASWAASATSDDAAATHGGHWKITQYMYQQLPEQSRGLLRHLASPPAGFGHVPHPFGVAEHDAAPTVTLIYLPVQGPCR